MRLRHVYCMQQKFLQGTTVLCSEHFAPMFHNRVCQGHLDLLILYTFSAFAFPRILNELTTSGQGQIQMDFILFGYEHKQILKHLTWFYYSYMFYC